MGRGWTTTKLKGSAGMRGFRTYLVVDFFFGCAAGLALRSFQQTSSIWEGLVYAILELSGFVTTFIALSAADLTWGWPEMGSYQTCYNVASCVWFVVMASVWITLVRVDQVAGWCVLLNLFPTVLVGLRGWPLCFGGSFLFVMGYFDVHSRVLVAFCPRFIKLAIALFASSRLRYLLDQRRAFGICMQPLVAHFIGDLVMRLTLQPSARRAFDVLVVSGVGASLVYGNTLLARHRRRMPPGLANAKFIRFGFLREMLATGQIIQRCQDLPPEAFGDVSKARHLIIVSHRWHDPRTSDVVTEDCPHGVKLRNLVRRLEEYFSPSLRVAFWWQLSRWYRTCCIGGWDVLVFFDFMSIPQNGIAADGSIIPRTPVEKLTFDECLPNMGTLYSLFPVLTLTDEPTGDTSHSYIDSGWCLCEFTIAMLGHQLSPHSTATLSSFKRQSFIQTSTKCMARADAENFMRNAEMELAKRPFYQESDRKVARGIIEGFLAKRLLADSIRRGDVEEVQVLLAKLKKNGLLATLDEPIDNGLNTLLHLAVQSRSVYIVMALLLHGARPYLRNLRGDTPSQWLLFPRLSAAAIVVRVAGSSFKCIAEPPMEEADESTPVVRTGSHRRVTLFGITMLLADEVVSAATTDGHASVSHASVSPQLARVGTASTVSFFENDFDV